MIELLYFASQFQCSVNSAPVEITVDVYQNQQLVSTLSKDDRVLLPVNSVTDLTFQYNFINAGCSPTQPTEMVLGNKDTPPNLKGYSQQQSLQTILNGLQNYEELLAVELGTTNSNSVPYDLQDVLVIVNNNPNVNHPTTPTVIFPD